MRESKQLSVMQVRYVLAAVGSLLVGQNKSFTRFAKRRIPIDSVGRDENPTRFQARVLDDYVFDCGSGAVGDHRYDVGL